MILSIVLLSVTFSIDALGIGLSYGTRRVRVPFLSQLIIGLMSMIFMGAAIFFGDAILLYVDGCVAKILGASMLFVMGVFIICKSFFSTADYDVDNSTHIDFMEAVYLGAAMSIDAFAAGVSSGVSGCRSVWLPVCVAISQILFLDMGLFFGHRCVIKLNIKQSVFTFISGVLLIGLAVLRL